MAASSLNAVRVRLYFDYPPPGMPDCRMSWVLVDLNKCRVVADLCSVIREKFDYSRKTVLDLFIENCFLPPAECIYVVRDNDSIRVKVSSVSFEHVGKKRGRDDEGLIQTPTKRNRQEATEVNGLTKKKKKNRAKKKKREGQLGESGDYVKAAASSKEPSFSKSQTDKSNKKVLASPHLTNGKASSSGTHDKSSDSSDSSEEVSPNVSPRKSKSKHSTQVTASKCPTARKSSSSQEEDKNVPVKKSQKPTTSTSNRTPKGSTSSVPLKSTTNSSAAKRMQTSSDSSSSEDEPSAAARRANIPAKSGSFQQKSTTATSKAKPQAVNSSSSYCSSDSKSSKGRKSQALQKSISSLNKNVSSLQTQPTFSKNSTSSKKPSTNPIPSKSQASSDSSSSSEDEACNASVLVTPKPLKTVPDLCAATENGATPVPSTPVGSMLQDDEDKAEHSDSSSSDTELVIKKPNPQLMAGLTPRGRGRGFTDRAKGRGGVRGGFGRARGTPWKQNFHYSYDTEEQRQRKDTQTNKSLLLQNPPELSPRRDYSTLPLLAAPPAVGQKIAFKLLELTENYTPEVSDYKEGKIISFNPSTKMIELELLTRSQARTEPGKFDLVYQDADGSERVEYAVTFGSQLTERWDSLLEPRLIVQNTD
ncbi:Coilin [Bagarius yarrelli]|uniref:Coilin n=1 Tax=Bagarius yarrelli TaxID=175774 RepID=A0A556TVN8_BAGYA|nr:Coilin [Bagarius yarrelli]